MLYAPPIDRPPVLRKVVRSFAATKDKQTVKEERFDVTRRFLPLQLEVGDTVYRLRSQLVGVFYPGHIGADNGEFVVPEFFPDFVGRGRNPNDAFLDWRDQIHCQFQELYAKRPFEMTETEKATWHLLESQIDVNAYRLTTPLTLRQIGKVAARVRPLPERIEWEDGRKEDVLLDQMPGEFAAYGPGQHFEAIVVRDPVDFHLLKVSHIHRIKSLPQMTSEEFNDLIHSVPTTDTLPDADWD